MPRDVRRRLAAVMRPLLAGFGIVIVLIEEALWTLLGRLTARLARLPALARIEERIRRLPPYGAMVLFLLPIPIILPFKIAAVWLMAKGHAPAGVLVLLAAKVSGMAVWTRIYALCRPALCTLAWFVRLEATLRRWRDWAHEKIDRIPGLTRARALARTFAAAVKGWLGDAKA